MDATQAAGPTIQSDGTSGAYGNTGKGYYLYWIQRGFRVTSFA
jgi:hypothetical protein